MKKILIITNHDVVTSKLIELYHRLYGHTTKELFLCKIELAEGLRIGQKKVPHPSKTRLSHKMINPLSKFIVQSKPKKSVTARRCVSIIELIKKEHISTILLPIYLYDAERSNQINRIVSKIKRACHLEAIGIYV